MIFVTIGTQVAFDRLVSAVDDWAGARDGHDVVAQIGPTSLQPRHIRWRQSMPRDRFQKELEAADVLVAHAGLGTIITALENAKPIIVFPRRAALGEQRSDHQLASARAFVGHAGIAVAFHEEELRHHLDNWQAIPRPEKIGPFAAPELLATLKDFINGP